MRERLVKIKLSLLIIQNYNHPGYAIYRDNVIYLFFSS